MPDHNELRAQASTAIEALPRPITTDAALEAVRFLPKKEFGEFDKWLRSTGQSYLAKLNG
jgi:hypothetical protein